MANTHYGTGGVLATKLDDVDDIATTTDLRLALGTRQNTKDGGVAVYCRSTANLVGRSDVVRITNDFQADGITKANCLNAGGVGVALHALTTNQAGWFQIAGKATVFFTGTIDPALPLYTSDTAGALSITTASLSGAAVLGLMAVTSASAGVHTATAMFLNGIILRMMPTAG